MLGLESEINNPSETQSDQVIEANLKNNFAWSAGTKQAPKSTPNIQAEPNKFI